MDFSVNNVDILVFASDRLRHSFQEQCVSKQDVSNMINIILAAGADMLDRETLSSCEKVIGHSLILFMKIDNEVDRVIYIILFGLDDSRMAWETVAPMFGKSNGFYGMIMCQVC